MTNPHLEFHIYINVVTIQYKTNPDEVRKLIHWELCNRLKFDYCDGKFFKIPKRDFIFAHVKTGQAGT